MGPSFGLNKDQYGALAHMAMGALRMAEVEPCEIRFLLRRAAAPGCDVIFYGRSFVFTVRMERQEETVELFTLPLDCKLGGRGF